MNHTCDVLLHRRLLTYSSGFSYDGFEPLLMQWRAYHGGKSGTGTTLEERFLYPMVFEPGKAWKYGCSFDWLVRMVERVNDNINLEAHMEKNLWQPFRIKDMTFFFQQRPDYEARRPGMSMRDHKGSGKAMHATTQAWDKKVDDALEGMGVFSALKSTSRCCIAC